MSFESPTVLLAEDEAPVREIAAMILQDLGYKVIAVNDGDQALAVFRAGAEHVDLLLSDIRMPGSIDGVQLVSQAKGIDPKLRVVLMSGYTSADPPREVPFLPKPFTVAELERTVRDALTV